MHWKELKLALINHFPFEPTSGQERLAHVCAQFLLSSKPRCAMLIRGYAGTGKTSSIHAIIKTLPSIQLNAILLAPTGRAAKVLSHYSKKAAFTIHKNIYSRTARADGTTGFGLNHNKFTNTVFIVDEASMIGQSLGLGSSHQFQYRDLLEDLIIYVYSGHNNRLVIIGDEAQLPPVGLELSPALDSDYLKSNFNLTLGSIQLHEIVRQASNSGILYNATLIRDQIEQTNVQLPKFEHHVFDDVIRVQGDDLQDELDSAISNYGLENTIVITRSNKRANLFNQQIRHRILWHEEDVSAGERLMVVKNNYFWLQSFQEYAAPFIANGDFIEIRKIKRTISRYSFTFLEAEVLLSDYPNIPPLEVMLLSDTLMEDGPSLNPERQKSLYHEVAEDYLDLKDRKKIHQAVMKDPFYNALQVKFGYAVTCHKSQGGQWPVVFVDQGYLTEESIDRSFLRWLYTAFTRAQKKLYLINFHDMFFENNE